MTKKILLIIIWLLGGLALFKVGTILIADIYFSTGFKTGDFALVERAIELNNEEPTYHRNLGLMYAVTAKITPDSSLQSEVAALADAEFKTAISLNNQNLLTLKAAAIGYKELGDLTRAEEITKMIRVLSPTDPLE